MGYRGGHAHEKRYAHLWDHFEADRSQDQVDREAAVDHGSKAVAKGVQIVADGESRHEFSGSHFQILEGVGVFHSLPTGRRSGS